ncbi:MAG: HNH endonuclease [Phycisphaerae bacterium]|nr:HNH endonuclease [Phycisphaerae bacterium]
MQHGKCCYSEILIPEEGHGKAVEHFRPKAHFKWARNDWPNLLLVCPQCNGRKRDQFPEMLTDNEGAAKVVYIRASSEPKAAIIDPSSGENPEDHLTYILDDMDPLYGQVTPRNGSQRGRVTIEVTGIDDAVFWRERFERLNDVLQNRYLELLAAKKSGDNDCLAAALQPFERFVSSKEKFAGMAREFARMKKLGERFGLTIP